jgi:translocator protein
MLKDIIKPSEDSFRLLYAMIIGFIVSMKCKMGKDSGKSVKFRPPSYIFGIVWPILYILLGLSWINSNKIMKNKNIDILYFTLSSLLAIWIIVYSCMNDKKNAIFILLSILLSLLVLMILIPQKSMLLLAPLTVWIFFAILLNTTEVQNI